MMARLLLLAGLWVAAAPVTAQADSAQGSRTSPARAANLAAPLYNELQQAVNAQNWRRAIQAVDELIAATPQRAGELKTYRSQLQRLLGAGFAQTTTARPGQPVRVQVKRRDSGIAIIDVLFNRKQQFEMVVDSGASITVITRPMATVLGLTARNVVDRATFATANGSVVMPIVYVDVMEVGRLHRFRVPVAIANSPMGVGLLGQDFLQHYDVSFKANVIEFSTRTR